MAGMSIEMPDGNDYVLPVSITPVSGRRGDKRVVRPQRSKLETGALGRVAPDHKLAR
jgi:hypothetical protein